MSKEYLEHVDGTYVSAYMRARKRDHGRHKLAPVPAHGRMLGRRGRQGMQSTEFVMLRELESFLILPFMCGFQLPR
jgi:hypothetical protein